IGLDNIAVITIPANDAAATSFVAPVGALQVTNSGTITLKITNVGTAPIDFATNNAVVGVRLTNPSGVSVNYTTTLNTGGITSTSTQDVTITTAANFSSLGVYTLKGGITLSGDGNSLNDSTANVIVLGTPLVKNAIVSGNWGDGATWAGGTIPTSTDSVNIVGFNVTLDGAAAAPYNAYSINIGAAGTLTGGPKALVVGNTGGGRNAFNIASTGTLTVNAGTNITHNGFMFFNSGSNFTMSGGNLTIDGNDGTNNGSVPGGTHLFAIGGATAYSTGTLNVTGGTLTIVDPHRFGGNAFHYQGSVTANFAPAHVLQYGDGASNHLSNGSNGFLQNQFAGGYRLGFGSITVNGGSDAARALNITQFNSGITGTLTVTSGSHLLSSLDLNLSGNLVNNGVIASSSAINCRTFVGGTAGVSANAQSITGTGRFRNNFPTFTTTTPGTGYTIGDLITLAGGTFSAPLTLRVTNVNGTGAITSAIVSNMGDYTIEPTYPASVTGGTGTGATFTITSLRSTATIASMILNNSHANGVTLANTFGNYASQTGGISGTLTLTNGILNNQGGGALVLGTSVTSRGTLTYTNGFIRGKFGRWFGAATNSGTTGDFPVGKDTIQMARVEFTGAPNKGGVLTAEFINTNPGFTGLPLNDAGQNLDKVATEGYWRIDNDTITGGVYTLSLTGRKFANVQTLATLRSVKRPTNGTTWSLNGTAGTNSGTLAIPVVVRTGMSGFSEFAIAGGTDNVLPYTKLSFTGVKTANGNKLNWIVTNEFNSKGYQLERSIDGVNFAEINYVSSKNVLSTPSNTEYSFTDFAPFKGNTYYRLKQLDNDGKFSYSNIVLMRGLKTTTLSINGVYPNPTSNVLNLVIASPSDKLLSIRVMDINGKVVVQNSRNVVSGDNVLQLNIKALAKGTYSIQAICNEGCETKSQIFVKQ
ncbi:MAG: beta strand repeat-containing protein, partial [Chitinophagaceae bacterium]